MLIDTQIGGWTTRAWDARDNGGNVAVDVKDATGRGHRLYAPPKQQRRFLDWLRGELAVIEPGLLAA